MLAVIFQHFGLLDRKEQAGGLNAFKTGDQAVLVFSDGLPAGVCWGAVLGPSDGSSASHWANPVSMICFNPSRCC
jgi:hypothetical protein